MALATRTGRALSNRGTWGRLGVPYLPRMYRLSAETHNVKTRVVHYVGSKERLETEPCPNMASAVPVVEDGEDFSFLPLIHDIIKW